MKSFEELKAEYFFCFCEYRDTKCENCRVIQKCEDIVRNAIQEECCLKCKVNLKQKLFGDGK